MELVVIAQGKKDPPKMTHIPPPVFDLTHIEALTVCVVEGGMQSGEPSVLIVVSDDNDFGSVVLQTSLDKFMAGASGMAAIAEKNWGWKRPEGHFTMLPPSKEARKVMLESIKKELEEWNDLDD